MKTKDIQALQSKNQKELEDLVRQTQAELVKLRVDLGAGKIKDVHAVVNKSRDLARVKTILRGKELNENA